LHLWAMPQGETTAADNEAQSQAQITDPIPQLKEERQGEGRTEG